MKKSNFKRFVSAGITALMVASSIPSIPAAVVQAADQQTRGNIGGYDYEMWNQNGQGQVSMQPSAGSFTCSWSNIENFLARMGKNYDSKKQNYKSIGKDITLTYDVEYTPRGNSYMCVYGWTRNPLMEYYIVEGWGDWRPPGNGAENKGTVTLDGNTYDIAKTMRYNQPSLDGTATFPQYWSIRQRSGSANNQTNYMKGTIHVGKHFDAWSQKGLDMSGTLYEVSLNIEGYRSNGSANVKSVKVYENGLGDDTTTTVTTPSEPVKGDANGDFFTSTFESGKDNWSGRGDASVATDSSNYYSGSKSLYVSGRSQEWNGCSIALDSSKFIPGQTYSFSAAVMQKTGSSSTIQMSLQQGDGDGASYTQIATADTKSGEWTKIENTKFTIPANSGDMLLYIETPESSGDLCDFYVDAVQVSESGKSSSVKTGGGTVDTSTPTPTPGGGEDETPIVIDEGLGSHQNMDYTYKKGGDGFKDHAGPLFRLGTSVSANEINTSQGQNFIKQNYNSITCENEMKPDSIVAGVNGDNVNISLRNADPILKFAQQNGIGVRGHTFVWYSQTPNSLFQENGRDVSADRMNKRLESMIKNTFDAIKKNYPNLKLHSYDVCNELFVNDGGGMRPASNSGWVRVYGNDSFVINAFKYARQYAPSTTKLYLNDYNEYMSAKTNDLYNMAKKVMAEGNYIDGIGMQSHLDSRYPSASEYETAIKKFESLGLDVQVTELDITNSTGTNSKLYPEIFEVICKHAKNISCVTLWGTTDERSWRYRENGGSPLPFSNYQPKSFYNDIIKIMDKYAEKYENEVTTTTTTTAPVVTTTTAPVVTQDPKSAFEAKVSKWGDANKDSTVDMGDVVLIMQSLANPNKYSLTEQQTANADVYQAGSGITTNDALALQRYLLGLIKSLPESWSSNITNPPVVTTTTKKATTTTTTQKVTTTTTKPTGTTANGQKFSVGNGKNQYKGTSDGYSYEIWLDNTGGSGNMTLGKGATFSTDWSAQVSSGNFLARRGLDFDRTKKATDCGKIVMDYAADYSASSQGNSRLCVYGWMTDPLVEYYIIEDWVNWCPKPNGASKTVTIDGAEYEIFQLDHYGPTILDNQSRNFKQYFSVRKSKRTSGTITVSDHFKAWANAGWNIGNLTEVALNVEGWESSGKANVSSLSIEVTGGGSQQGSDSQQDTDSQQGTTPKVDKTKKLCAISFDDGASATSRQDPAYRIMDALIKNNMTATFFYVGDWIKTNDQVKFAYQNGMEVANHTKSHPSLGSLGSQQIRSEWEQCNSKLKNIIGTEPSHLMRLPYLDGGGQVKSALYDVPLISCAIDTKDWDNASKDQIVNTIKQAAQNGSLEGAIVLCHENYATTAAAMEEVLPWLAQNGYQNVNISDLAAAKGKTLAGGQIHTRV
ncbi:MAG: glycoside hydrolase family 11 protein [Ruminococcus sp.]|nr:glycoside hydrolase family 11 protein [Ruminococcus sp.]